MWQTADMQHRLQDGQLDPEYSPSSFLSTSIGQRISEVDAVTVLYHHLNHTRNAAALPALLQAAHTIGPAATRLLKLLVHSFYTPELYTDEATTVARGAFAYVQKRSLVVGPGSKAAPVHVAEKVQTLRVSFGRRLDASGLES
jgi:hypothetical protein